MKNFIALLFVVFALGWMLQACDDTKTYAEMVEDEDNGIADFINQHQIKVISQSQFYAQDSTTNLEENEYVELDNGVYMQIVDKGSDNPADTVKNNDQILVRFTEFSILDGDTTLSNMDVPDLTDIFRYTISSNGSVSGTFLEGYMLSAYNISSVPGGWLVPLTYVRPGSRADDSRAHVRVIVPSDMGHQTAMQYVYPYFYELKYQIW